MYINDKLINTLTGSVLSSNGCIKLSNGFMLQWKKVTATFTNTAWGSIYYKDLSVGNWTYAFKALYGMWANIKSGQWWCTAYEQTTSSAGNVRVFRPTSGSVTEDIYIFGIGTWK